MKRSALQALAARWALAALGGLAGASASAQIAIDEINPIRSSLHATNANGGSGGRIQSVAADPQDGSVFYAASEWGGLYKTADRGRTWDRLDNFLATAAWRVAVQPGNSQVLVATALFDGRTDSRAGILRSSDGGLSWTRPASVTPPAGACADDIANAIAAELGTGGKYVCAAATAPRAGVEERGLGRAQQRGEEQHDCNGGEDAPLEVLANHLVFGVEPRRVLADVK